MLGTEIGTPHPVHEGGQRDLITTPHTCHPTHCSATHQRVQDVVAGDGLHIIQGLSYGLATCHVSCQLGTPWGQDMSVSSKPCSPSSPSLHPTKEGSTHPALGPGDVGLKEVQQLLQEGPRVLRGASGEWRCCTPSPLHAPCPLRVRIRAVRPPQPSSWLLPWSAIRAGVALMGGGTQGCRGPPGKMTGWDEQPDIAWHPCAEGGLVVGVQPQSHWVAWQQGKASSHS